MKNGRRNTLEWISRLCKMKRLYKTTKDHHHQQKLNQVIRVIKENHNQEELQE